MQAVHLSKSDEAGFSMPLTIAEAKALVISPGHQAKSKSAPLSEIKSKNEVNQRRFSTLSSRPEEFKLGCVQPNARSAARFIFIAAMTVPPHPHTPYQITHPHLHTATLLIHPYDLCLFSLETGYRAFSLTFLTRFVFIGSGSDEWCGQMERRSRLAHRASNDGGATRALSKTISGAKEGIHVGKRLDNSVVLPLVLKKTDKKIWIKSCCK